jgi:CheY-like chemotaxis protein
MTPRILLHVDDSEDELFLFRRSFEKSGLDGWQLQSASGGAEALKYLKAVTSDKATKPDLVLLDLRMPIVNGFGVLEWLRGNMPEVRVAVYSSSVLKEDREKASALGAVAYLPKSEAVSVTEFVRNWAAEGNPERGIETPTERRS